MMIPMTAIAALQHRIRPNRDLSSPFVLSPAATYIRQSNCLTSDLEQEVNCGIVMIQAPTRSRYPWTQQNDIEPLETS
jgi:hypothetical protein